MRRTALAAAALLGASAVSGATILPGSATAETEDKAQVKRFVLHEKTSHDLGRFTFAGTDVAKRHGEVIGYDAITGRYFPATDSVTIDVSFALKGGIITARVKSDPETPNQYNGPILGGTGKYRGIDGTISARSPGEDSPRTFVVLHYHF